MLSVVAINHGAPVPEKRPAGVWKPYYRPSHAGHPCTRWAGETRANWLWAMAHGLALCHEYRARFGKRHASEDVLLRLVYLDQQYGFAPQEGALTEPPQAMRQHPECMYPDTIVAYRRYYVHVKVWAMGNGPPRWEKGTPPPSWWQRAERFRGRMRATHGHSLERQREPDYLPLLTRYLLPRSL